MIFTRSIPPRQYRNYKQYRHLLRQDFQYRCAYCLTHEFYLGGEANFAIDHHRPRYGVYGRLDLEHSYANLYWCCAECNQNKGDEWTSPEEEALGYRWLDPCEEWGDHDRHWHIAPDGEITWLTPIGEYTVKTLMLHKRDWLKAYWRETYKRKQLRDALAVALNTRNIPETERRLIKRQLEELDFLLNPPVFHRSRKNQQTE